MPLSNISELIRNVQIENVRVIQAHIRSAIKSPDEVGVIEAKIGRSATVAQLPEDGLFMVNVDFVFGVHSQDEKKASPSNAKVAVTVTFELTYRIPATMSAREDELTEFAKVNGIFNAWPYFREFVHASLARMGLPPVILPVYRLSLPKKAGSKTKPEKPEHAKPHAAETRH